MNVSIRPYRQVCDRMWWYTMIGFKMQDTDNSLFKTKYARVHDNLWLPTRLYKNVREHPIVCDNMQSYTTIYIRFLDLLYVIKSAIMEMAYDDKLLVARINVNLKYYAITCDRILHFMRNGRINIKLCNATWQHTIICDQVLQSTMYEYIRSARQYTGMYDRLR